MDTELFHYQSKKGTNLIDGKLTETSVKEFIKNRYNLENYGIAIHLIEPTVNNSRTESSLVSLRKKNRLMNDIGIRTIVKIHSSKTSLKDLRDDIDKDNNDRQIAGIIVQLPVPNHLIEAISRIKPEKDIDHINESNDVWQSCATANAAERILFEHRSKINRIAVVGANGFVGNQIANRIKQEKYGELVAIDTNDHISKIENCDTIITAVGRPNLIQAKNINYPYLGIDIGNTKEGIYYKGDFDFDSIDGYITNLTPVPGGMGPLEMVVLAERIVQNTIDSSFHINFKIK